MTFEDEARDALRIGWEFNRSESPGCRVEYRDLNNREVHLEFFPGIGRLLRSLVSRVELAIDPQQIAVGRYLVGLQIFWRS